MILRVKKSHVCKKPSNKTRSYIWVTDLITDQIETVQTTQLTYLLTYFRCRKGPGRIPVTIGDLCEPLIFPTIPT